jgi:hypothetical protein
MEKTVHYPHNLKIQRNQNNEMIKGGILLVGMVTFTAVYCVFSDYAGSGSNSQFLVCHDAGGKLSCQLAQN